MNMSSQKPSVFYRGCTDFEKEKVQDVLKKYYLSLGNSNIAIIKIIDSSEDSRLIIRRIINDINPFLILMSSNIEVSNFAWQCQANCFVLLSKTNWDKDLENALKTQFQNLNFGYRKKIKINTHAQIDIVDPIAIVVVLAQGNYSELRLNCGKKIVVSKQIGVLEKELENWTQLQRFGKSIIVNLNMITSIKNKTITFKNNEQFSFPKYSRSFVCLKNRLLWNK